MYVFDLRMFSGVAVSCVDDGFVATSGLYLAVERVLQVSTAGDGHRRSKRREEERREMDRV